MTETTAKQPVIVPRWIVRTIWIAHRAVYRLTGGRFGLRTSNETRWGMLRLRTVGRKTGQERIAIVGYIEDGPNVVIPAMNGWADPEPAWFLNLVANPDATVVLPDGTERRVVARVAPEDQRRELWARFVALGTAAYSDANAAQRARPTQIAILEPAAK